MSIFLIAGIIGLVLPFLSFLILYKRDKTLKNIDIVFILFQVIQIASERVLAKNGLIQIIKYTAICFVGLRLFQLAFLWPLREKISNFKGGAKYLLITTYFSNWILWAYVFVRLGLKIFHAFATTI